MPEVDPGSRPTMTMLIVASRGSSGSDEASAVAPVAFSGIGLRTARAAARFACRSASVAA
ncbi:MAG: hypothetical protein BGO98_22530 [Myxococcales bacterium 68-20]|nr:MAG: hypothetical protein BGO98_22530 [Myxococcales bacterium 68-20]